MTTHNSLNLSLDQQTGTGKFVGDTSASVTGLLVNSKAPIVNITGQAFGGAGTYTYTPSAGMLFCLIDMVGGGGGGGGCPTSSAAQVCVAGSGSAGAYTRTIFPASVVGASKTVVVGSGGLGGAPGNNNGADGTSSTFGTLITSGGGKGGVGGSSSVFPIIVGATGGQPLGGDINVNGDNGGISIGNGATQVAISAPGGSSKMGGGGASAVGTSAGTNAPTVTQEGGGGGSGAAVIFGGANQAGGQGCDGFCLITEFCSQ